MALALKNFVGFETGGLEEAKAASGNLNLVDSGVRTGDHSLEMPDNTGRYGVDFEGGLTEFVVGLAVKVTDIVPAGTARLLTVQHGAGDVFYLYMGSDGDLKLYNTAEATFYSAAWDWPDTDWHYVEVYFKMHGTAGAFEVFVDGTPRISESSKDTLPETDADNVRLMGSNLWVPTYDDIYIGAATAGADRLGDCEVFRYQANTNSATPDTGDALNTGVWQNCGQTPGAGGEAVYTGTPLTGAVYTDDTESGKYYRHGPHGDGNIDGTIEAGKWLHRLKRGNGGGTTHYKRYGNDGDGLTDEAVPELTISYANLETISTAAAVVPTDQEHFAQGFRVDGGRDLLCEEMWAFILHVPPVGPPPARRVILS